MCEFFDISESGITETMTAHGLRETDIGKYFECGNDLSAVALHTGHSSLKSLAFYENLHGSLRLRQQLDLFSSTAESLRFVKQARMDKDDVNYLDRKLFGEKVAFPKNSPKLDTSPLGIAGSCSRNVQLRISIKFV